MPTPEPRSAQLQSVPGVPNKSECPWSARVPGVPNFIVSLAREGGDARSTIMLHFGPTRGVCGVSRSAVHSAARWALPLRVTNAAGACFSAFWIVGPSDGSLRIKSLGVDLASRSIAKDTCASVRIPCALLGCQIALSAWSQRLCSNRNRAPPFLSASSEWSFTVWHDNGFRVLKGVSLHCC